MPNVRFEEQDYLLNENETVLDCLLRNGHAIAYGCRAGVCQSCVLAVAEVSANISQQGLNEQQKVLKHFLSCQSRPVSDVAVKRTKDFANQHAATVVAKQWLNESVIHLQLRCDIKYRAGQYLTLWRDDSCARSYSLASMPNFDGLLDFHIKHIANGEFSGWVANSLNIGDSINVRGPMGDFFYSSDSHQPLVMCALGTGLAPVYGILKSALAAHHQAAIDVVVAARSARDFYLLAELQQLVSNHDNITLHFVAQVIESDSPIHSFKWSVIEGDIYQYCKTQFTRLDNCQFYLCGAESFVGKLRKQLFLAGANLRNISADMFVYSG